MEVHKRSDQECAGEEGTDKKGSVRTGVVEERIEKEAQPPKEEVLALPAWLEGELDDPSPVAKWIQNARKIRADARSQRMSGRGERAALSALAVVLVLPLIPMRQLTEGVSFSQLGLKPQFWHPLGRMLAEESAGLAPFFIVPVLMVPILIESKVTKSPSNLTLLTPTVVSAVALWALFTSGPIDLLPNTNLDEVYQFTFAFITLCVYSGICAVFVIIRITSSLIDHLINKDFSYHVLICEIADACQLMNETTDLRETAKLCRSLDRIATLLEHGIWRYLVSTDLATSSQAILAGREMGAAVRELQVRAFLRDESTVTYLRTQLIRMVVSLHSCQLASFPRKPAISRSKTAAITEKATSVARLVAFGVLPLIAWSGFISPRVRINESISGSITLALFVWALVSLLYAADPSVKERVGVSKDLLSLLGFNRGEKKE